LFRRVTARTESALPDRPAHLLDHRSRRIDDIPHKLASSSPAIGVISISWRSASAKFRMLQAASERSERRGVKFGRRRKLSPTTGRRRLLGLLPARPRLTLSEPTTWMRRLPADCNDTAALIATRGYPPLRQRMLRTTPSVSTARPSYIVWKFHNGSRGLGHSLGGFG
jgi:hypothetical protein